MDLKQGQFTTQELRQELTLSAQQIQALNILAAPVLELNQLISQEMAANPVLDMEDNYREVSLEAAEEKLVGEALQLENSSGGGELYYNSPEGEARRKHFFDSITSTASFDEGLANQLRLMDLDKEMLRVCVAVIGEIDPSGYLVASDEEIAEAGDWNLKLVKKAVKTVQSLDPVGIAARNLKERLLLQLQRKGYRDTDLLKVVKEHLEDIAANRLPQICRKLRISMERLNEIIDVIKKLRPSLDETTINPAEYVQEEMIVKIENGEPKVELLNNRLPSLKISSYYQKLIDDQGLSAEDRRFIKAKISGAVEFMKKIHNRQSTIEKIANIIVRHQKRFFFEGDQALVPLTMSQVAEEIGCHETTVSRAVAGKYLRCRYGMVPLR